MYKLIDAIIKGMSMIEVHGKRCIYAAIDIVYARISNLAINGVHGCICLPLTVAYGCALRALR
jgi:hypothetical protein